MKSEWRYVIFAWGQFSSFSIFFICSRHAVVSFFIFSKILILTRQCVNIIIFFFCSTHVRLTSAEARLSLFFKFVQPFDKLNDVFCVHGSFYIVELDLNDCDYVELDKSGIFTLMSVFSFFGPLSLQSCFFLCTFRFNLSNMWRTRSKKQFLLLELWFQATP